VLVARRTFGALTVLAAADDRTLFSTVVAGVVDIARRCIVDAKSDDNDEQTESIHSQLLELSLTCLSQLSKCVSVGTAQSLRFGHATIPPLFDAMIQRAVNNQRPLQLEKIAEFMSLSALLLDDPAQDQLLNALRITFVSSTDSMKIDDDAWKLCQNNDLLKQFKPLTIESISKRFNICLYCYYFIYF